MFGGDFVVNDIDVIDSPSFQHFDAEIQRVVGRAAVVLVCRLYGYGKFRQERTSVLRYGERVVIPRFFCDVENVGEYSLEPVRQSTVQVYSATKLR